MAHCGHIALGTIHSVGLPIHVYPLYENAFRAHRNQSLHDNSIESAQLYAEFAKVAEQHPLAWNYGQTAATEDVIRTVTRRNRMICFPCKPALVIPFELTEKNTDPLLMNAFNNVNLAGTCLLTSTDYAKELGIPESHWIYPLGGAGTHESENCRLISCTYYLILAKTLLSKVWERPNYYSSPAISRSLDAGLNVSGLTKEDINLFDFYSSAVLCLSFIYVYLTNTQLLPNCSKTRLPTSRSLNHEPLQAYHAARRPDLFRGSREQLLYTRKSPTFLFPIYRTEIF